MHVYLRTVNQSGLLFHETTKAIGLQKVIYSEKYISTPYKKYTGKNIYFICYHPIHIQLIGL